MRFHIVLRAPCRLAARDGDTISDGSFEQSVLLASVAGSGELDDMDTGSKHGPAHETLQLISPVCREVMKSELEDVT